MQRVEWCPLRAPTEPEGQSYYLPKRALRSMRHRPRRRGSPTLARSSSPGKSVSRQPSGGPRGGGGGGDDAGDDGEWHAGRPGRVTGQRSRR